MQYDVIIIGAGAAGIMCAMEAGKRGRRVWLIDHYKKTAEKIRISGGGRCNFTNIHAGAQHYLSENPHFCKSALSRYTQHDFIALVKKHSIAFHEKKLGQLFCDGSASNIITMLEEECRAAGVVFEKETRVSTIQSTQEGCYLIESSRGAHHCNSLVIATGGLSIPKIGASKFGYDIARQFELKVTKTRAGLVPLTFQNDLLARCKSLTGLSVEAIVSCGKGKTKTSFSEGLLFTHRGLSGPSILQISSYWQEGEDIVINLAPHNDMFSFFKDKKSAQPKQEVQNAVSEILPKRLAESICNEQKIKGRIADLADKKLKTLGNSINEWRIMPSGTEGYRTAEVTLGGIDTDELSSKTMESRKQRGLYFIGEVVDVTGHLGGFNFQWAWSSGYAAGQYV